VRRGKLAFPWAIAHTRGIPIAIHPIRTTLALGTAVLLAFAPAALADTVVSIEDGNFGSGLNGRYLYVRDKPSLFDQKMDVSVIQLGGDIRVKDDAGEISAKGDGCLRLSGVIFCRPDGLDGIRLEGGAKDDVLLSSVDLPAAWDGRAGKDDLQGGPNRDQMHGGNGDDVMRGGAGQDTTTLESGQDRFDGQADTDTVSYGGATASVSVTLHDNAFNDGVASEPDKIVNTENLIGSPQTDFLGGSDVRNVISARAGNDTIVARDGDDLLDGEEGGDAMIGDFGTDTVTYADRTAPVTVTLAGAEADGELGEADNLTGVENLEGGSAGDTLNGSTLRNHLDGNGGDDVLDGKGGDDRMDGGTGNDTIVGDVDSDIYIGGLGTDLLDYSARTEPVDVSLAPSIALDDGGASDGQGDNASGIENVNGGSGDDKLTGAVGFNTIDGGPGDDEVHIEDGAADKADCGLGFDLLEFDLPFDSTVNCEQSL
jgi:Ca2+-binding RTX toxin-like protein